MNKQSLIIITLFFLLTSGFSQNILSESFQNEVFELNNIDLGLKSVGTNTMTAAITNRSKEVQNCVIDIRTECIGLGRRNWQYQYFYQILPGDRCKISIEYVIPFPMIQRIVIRFGKSSKPFNLDKWINLSAEERKQYAYPDVDYLWTKILEEARNVLLQTEIYETVAAHEIYLNTIPGEKITSLKNDLPDLIQQSRQEENPLRSKLNGLFMANRKYPDDFAMQAETWARRGDYYDSLYSKNGVAVDVFSIAGEGMNRISAFFSTKQENVTKKKPLIILLSGNPPGTKEGLISASLYFSRLGFHTVGIDRRESSRLLDKKEKFLPVFSDPVADLLRLMDYLGFQTRYKISKIGIYGFSAGAGEAKFAAALDDRIQAVVLACGVTSFDQLFKDREGWIPTLSGMIIYPELGLGNPPIGEMSSDDFWIYFEKATPQHDQKARKVFNQIFPFFEDLDPKRVVPLIAPVPMMIVTGAQDDQFQTAGVVEVDIEAMTAYREYDAIQCSELLIQPRTGHTVSTRGGYVISAFFMRWLY